MARMLRGAATVVNRKRVQRLMRLMGIAALGPKPRTSTPAPGHRTFPYLLRRLRVDRPNQVWAADISYLPIGRGFSTWWRSWTGLDEPRGAELAVVQHDGRFVLPRGARGGAGTVRQPEIFNADQGSQFTSAAFTGALEQAGVQISMDGRGRWMDNVFIERLWRSVKHEDVYLKGYADGREARIGIAEWIAFYNTRRPHQALGYATPMEVWCDGIVDAIAAKAVGMWATLLRCPSCPQPRRQQQTASLAA
jgi:putative transposase